MRIYIHHTTLGITTQHGKYKLLSNALMRAKETKEWWNTNNITWMRIWIGE